jgi:hypothetical protein
MALCEMHFRLSTRIYKNGAQRSASGADSPMMDWSIPMFRADFLTLASIFVQI